MVEICLIKLLTNRKIPVCIIIYSFLSLVLSDLPLVDTLHIALYSLYLYFMERAIGKQRLHGANLGGMVHRGLVGIGPIDRKFEGKHIPNWSKCYWIILANKPISQLLQKGIFVPNFKKTRQQLQSLERM